MTSTTEFSILSPERVVLSGQAEMVIIPGTEGDFGVLPGHAPFVSGLRPGRMTLHEAGGVRHIFVAGGVAETTPQGCTVLAEEAVLLTDINADEVRQNIANLQEDISVLDSAEEQDRLQAALVIAEAKLEALSD